MADVPGAIRPCYSTWPQYNDAVIAVARELTPEQLAIRPAPDRMTIWQTLAHMAGPRVYWLCGVLAEPGAKDTPFPDPFGDGWEDDESRPRTATELVHALESTWLVVDGVLGRWTPDMLAERFTRDMPMGRQWHSRGQLLLRLLTHDAWHAAEISQTLGILGGPQVDLWRADAVEPR